MGSCFESVALLCAWVTLFKLKTKDKLHCQWESKGEYPDKVTPNRHDTADTVIFGSGEVCTPARQAALPVGLEDPMVETGFLVVHPLPSHDEHNDGHLWRWLHAAPVAWYIRDQALFMAEPSDGAQL